MRQVFICSSCLINTEQILIQNKKANLRCMKKTLAFKCFQDRISYLFYTTADIASILLLMLLLSFPAHSQTQVQKTSFSVIPLGVKGGLDESNLSAYLVGAAGNHDYVCVDAGTVHFGI